MNLYTNLVVNQCAYIFQVLLAQVIKITQTRYEKYAILLFQDYE